MAYVYPFFDTDENIKRVVFNKGTPISGYDASRWRRDICGRAMDYYEHGNTNSEYGWEIDHIYPATLGGLTEINNLQPLYWENNRLKADQYPWSCP